MSNIGQTLKNIRKQNKMTQAELANGLVNRSYISQIEKGIVQPSFKIMTLLAKRLDVDISVFYDNLELKALSGTEVKNQIKISKYQLEVNNLTALDYLIENLINLPNESYEKLSATDQIDYYYVLSSYFFKKNKFDLVLKNSFQGVHLCQIQNDEQAEIQFLVWISKVYIEKSDFHVALNYLNKSNKLIISSRSMGLINIEVLLNMAICHGRIKEYYSAIRICEEALHINKITDSNHKSGEIFMTLGICYKNIGSLDSSFCYYEKAMKYFDLFEQQYNKAGVLINLAILHRENKDFEECISLVKEARGIFEFLKDDYQLFNCDVELFKTNIKINLSPSLIKDFKILDSLIPISYSSLKADLHTTMLQYYFYNNDYKNALIFLKNSSYIIEKDLYLAEIFYNLEMWEKSSSSFMKYYYK